MIAAHSRWLTSHESQRSNFMDHHWTITHMDHITLQIPTKFLSKGRVAGHPFQLTDPRLARRQSRAVEHILPCSLTELATPACMEQYHRARSEEQTDERAANALRVAAHSKINAIVTLAHECLRVCTGSILSLL